VSGGWGQTLFSGAQRQDKGQWAQMEAQEVPADHEEELLPSEGDGALGFWLRGNLATVERQPTTTTTKTADVLRVCLGTVTCAGKVCVRLRYHLESDNLPHCKN